MFDKHPTLKQFDERYKSIKNEILNPDSEEGFIYSYKIKGAIKIIDDSTDVEFDIIEITFGQLLGCGCPNELIIKVKQNDSNS
jgi:hypothetical protein